MGILAFGRARGKPYRRNLAEFAEKVSYRIGNIDYIKKLEARWNEGIFFGVNWRTGEATTGTKDGILHSSAIR